MKVLVVSDIHSNPFPLRIALEENYDKAIFLGDSVDYGPYPGEVIDLLKENFDIHIMGNHDYAVAYGVDCKCGEENHDISVYSRENITLKLLSKEDIDFLKKFKESDSIISGSTEINIYHGAPWDHLYGYIFPWKAETLNSKGQLGLDDGDYFLIGHTHHQFILTKGGKTFINPGSLGQPRDIIGFPSYLIMDMEKYSFEFKRVKYDKTKLYSEIEKIVNDPQMQIRLKAMF